MKSILQSIALLSAAVLIASCDSSSGGGAAAVVVTPAPQASTSGSAVKGIITGAVVTATDAGGTGRVIGQSTVIAGTYDIAYDNSLAPFTDPIVVTVTGGNALCDYENPDGSGNDCQQLDGTFVAFGASYDITGTVLRSNIAAGTAGGISNVSPLSEIAASKAATPLTAASVTAANLAISGLIQEITGVDLGGVDFTTIAPSDLTATGNVTDSDAQLAIAAFGAAIIGSQGPGESISATIARLTAGLTIDPATGGITGTGTALGAFTSAYAVGLTTAAKRRPTAALAAAVTKAKNTGALYTSLGANPVIVQRPAPPSDTATPITTVRAFVVKLSNVIDDVLNTTGAQGGGQTAISTTEAFATQLDAVAAVNSANATKAFTKLDAALKADAAEITAGTKTSPVTNDAETADGLAYVLTRDSAGFTVTGVSSKWPLMEQEGGNTVTLTADTATASGSTFSIPAATLTTTSGTTTLQTFTGSATRTAGAAAGTSNLSLNGSVTNQTAGVALSILLTASGVPNAAVDGTDETTRISGTYEATFSFATPAAADIGVKMFGTIGANAQSFTFTTPSGAINATVTRAVGAGDNGASDQVTLGTLSDGNVTLVLSALENGSLPATGTIGTFKLSGSDVATLSGNGLITYSDGTTQILPLLLFPDPS